MPVPSRAACLALAVIAVARLAFLAWPDAFIAYPEILHESSFYELDQRCASSDLEPQIVVQGTSRLLPVDAVSLGQKRWRSRDHVVNLSAIANTFWHMAALLRRHPHLLDHADLQVIDLVPLQLTVYVDFDEGDALFLRESTFAEKWLISNPFTRLKAFADLAMPVWSQRHTAANWFRLLAERPRTAQERLASIRRIPSLRFEEMQEIGRQLSVRPGDLDLRREVVASYLFPAGPQSEVQVHALAELIQRRPPSGQLLLVRAPYRKDFNQVVAHHSTMIEADRRLRECVAPLTKDGVLVEWFDTQENLGLSDRDFADDGAHFSPSGIAALEKHFAQTYRKLYPAAQ